MVIYYASQRYLQVTLVNSSEKSLRDIRLDLVQLVLLSKYGSVEQISNDRLLASFTTDANIISSCWPTIVSMYTSSVILFSGLAYLAYLTFNGFILTMSVVIIGVIIYSLMTQKASKYFEISRATEDSFLDHLQDLIYGGKELKINSTKRHNFYRQDFEQTASLCKSSNTKAKNMFFDAGLIGSMVYFLLIGFVSFYFDRIFLLEDSVKTAYLLLLVFLYSPLVGLVTTVPSITRALISVRCVTEIKSCLSNNLEKSCKILPHASFDASVQWKTITFKRVSYSYASDSNFSDDSESVYKLGPVDLTITAGDLIFVTGGNGSGKSTLGKLLTGIYLPTHGTITLDDTVITEGNIDTYRQMVSAVFNDNHLFSNLFGHENHAFSDIQDALQRLGLKNKVNHLEKNCSKRLSQGQKKRLALANTFLENRKILFFDEWASEQDPVFKHHFYTQMLPALKASGKTIIAITHDDRYFHIADRVVKVENGIVSTCDHQFVGTSMNIN